MNSQDNRLAVFNITQDDLATLRSLAGYARDRLPALLQELHPSFAPWPEIQRALALPEVHSARVSHWCRVVSGDVGAGFQESAHTLASLFYAHGVPAYAVAICHASVMNGILADMGLAEEAPRGWFGRRPGGAPIRAALNKGAWFDLELLLETYAAAEQTSRRAALTSMAEAIEREAGDAVAQVGALTGQMAETAQGLSATAGRTGHDADQAALAARQTRETADQVADAAEALTHSIDSIVRQVGASTDAARRAVSAGQGARQGIQAMSQQAEEIGKVADLIGDIAARTNLLALNATIEAARAGDAGKGFAVVASEVKQLATQTAQSTAAIARQIEAVRQATTNAAEEVGQVVGLISEIDATIAAVAAAVAEQGEATAAIGRSVLDTAGAATRMSELTEDVRAAAGETDRQSGSVRQTAAALDGAVRDLRQTVVRVVRTSTREVDRRQNERVDCELPAELRIGGDSRRVQVVNLSVSGALIAGAPAAPRDTAGVLAFAGSSFPCRVVTVRDGRLVVRLTPDDAQLGLIQRLLHQARAA
ncbi:chemotaxis protein [Rhodovarius crocodyli]|uniref:Chemotaxis protein n=1 Tax=Rhodovarius crocodyli TaxID=1979269 RepID=A0A437MJQ3_9PROT|nr:methyl-accepting chemotaxis protein [Rhodovarius crocodyli]RVT97872.1 chemotaxis protein [Rhodovarius crocodyli]